MMFGDNFKKYRKLSGLTQDEIARFLMVTPQAVSKWETGSGTPDISMLVPIAELFGISTDELLGRVNTLSDTTLQKIYTAEESRKDKYDKYIELLKSNPNNEKILLMLLSLATERLTCEKNSLSETEKDSLICAAQDHVGRFPKNAALGTLAEARGKLADVYIAVGDFRRAKEEIDSLPGSRYTKNRMLGNLALNEGKSEESRESYRESIYETVSYLLWDIERLAQSYGIALHNDYRNTRRTMDEIYELEYRMIHAIGVQNEPLLKHHLCNASVRLAQRATFDGDYEKAFQYLDEFISNAREQHFNVSDADMMGSPIFPVRAHTVHGVSKESVLFRLSWNSFHPIRSDPRFQKYLEEVEAWS